MHKFLARIGTTDNKVEMNQSSDIFLAIHGTAKRSRISIETSTGFRYEHGKFGPLAFRVNQSFAEDLSQYLKLFSRKAGFPSYSAFQPRVKSIAATISGLKTATEAFSFRQALKQSGFDPSVHSFIRDDLWAVLPAYGLTEAIVVKAASGASVLAVDREYRNFSVGGWGCELSEHGGGFQIGTSALRLAIDAHDQRKFASAEFTNAILDWIGLENPSQILSWYNELRRTPEWRSQVSDLAIPLCGMLESEKRNLDAQRIVDTAVEDVWRSLKSTIRRCMFTDIFDSRENYTLALTGSLLLNSDYFSEKIRKRLRRFQEGQMQFYGKQITVTEVAVEIGRHPISGTLLIAKNAGIGRHFRLAPSL